MTLSLFLFLCYASSFRIAVSDGSANSRQHPPCIGRQLDVYIVIDTSKSIREYERDIERQAVRNIIAGLDIGPSLTRVGIILYASSATRMFGLDEYASNAAMENIDVIPSYATAGVEVQAHTDKGIDLAMQRFYYEGRHGVPKVIIVMTDGLSTDYKLTKKAAEAAQATYGTTVLAVGIGLANSRARRELRTIASGLGEDNVFYIKNFEDLLFVDRIITTEACAAPFRTSSSVSCKKRCVRFGMVFGKLHHGSEVRHVCQPGRRLEGDEYATCGEDGKWSSDLPQCVIGERKCQFRATLRYGSVSYGQTFNDIGGTVAFSCEAGYQLDRTSDNQVCAANAKWQNQRPFCKRATCPVIQGIPGGLITSQNTMNGGTTSFQCYDGLTMIGGNQVTCNSNLQWSGPAPTCNYQTHCKPLLNEFMNGMVENAETNQANTMYRFSCFDGYVLEGSSTVTCLASGSWSAPFPSCKPIRCDWIPLLANGKIERSAGVSNTFMKFRCDHGFKLAGPDRVNCIHGAWDQAIPTCVENKCPPITEFANGRVIGYNRAVGSTIRFGCNKGYDVDGPNSATCQSNNQWTTLPKCSLKIDFPVIDETCTTIIDIVNGKCHGRVTSDSVTRCLCDPGYELVGSPIMCCKNGTWDGPVPSCKLTTCPELPALKGGFTKGHSSALGAIMEYHCHADHTLDGASSISCLGNREWSSPPPTCKETSCPNVVNIPYGMVSDVTTGRNEGARRRFECVHGYKMTGASYAICHNQNWIPGVPQCVRNSCDPLQFVEHGAVWGDDYRVGSSLKVVCADGYRLAGPAVITCRDDFTWSGHPKCMRNRCPTQEIFFRGSVSDYSEIPGSVVRFACDEGYTLEGPYQVCCKLDGTWSSPFPKCVPLIKCPVMCLADVDVIASGNLPGDVAYFSCHNGQVIHGAREARCLADGTWSRQMPTCKGIKEDVIEQGTLGPDFTPTTTESMFENIVSTTTTAVPWHSNPVTECMNKPFDIYIVADKSVSIEIEDLDIEREAIRRVYNSFDIGAGKTRVGLISYNTEAETEFTLSSYNSAGSINSASIVQRDAGSIGTHTNEALALLVANFQTEAVSGRKKVAIVFTDGRATTPEETSEQAAQLHATTDIKVIAVGIGKKANQEELQKIATGTGNDNVIHVNSFNALLRQITTVTSLACNNETVAPPTAAPTTSTTEDILGEIGRTTTATSSTTVHPIIESELPSEPVEACENKKFDAYFVVDKSKSLDQSEMALELAILRHSINRLDVAPDKTRVGLISYSFTTYLEFNLSIHESVDSINRQQILQRPNNKAGTLTGAALQLMNTCFDDEQVDGRPRVAILITDGKSTDPQLTLEMADKLSKTPIKMIVIGVGTNAKMAELRRIATGPGDENLLWSKSYRDLANIVDAIPTNMCNGHI